LADPWFIPLSAGFCFNIPLINMKHTHTNVHLKNSVTISESNFIFAVRECAKKGKGLKLFVWQDIKALHLLTSCKTLCTPTRPLTKRLPCIWLHRPRVGSTKLLLGTLKHRYEMTPQMSYKNILWQFPEHIISVWFSVKNPSFGNYFLLVKEGCYIYTDYCLIKQ